MFNFIKKLWKRQRSPVTTPPLDHPVLTLGGRGSSTSDSWMTLNDTTEGRQRKLERRDSGFPSSAGGGSESSRRSIIKSAIARLRNKRGREEFLVSEDISNGREVYKIPAMSFQAGDKAPSDYHYVRDYIQVEPVDLKLSLDSMSSCVCTGDCKNGLCSCSSLNGSITRYTSDGRLSAHYNIDSPELIYECNSGCKCNHKKCNNRVIQHGSRAKLALFKTKSRGWAVRSLRPLKRGSFIGIYAGELITVSDCRNRQDDTYLFNLSNTSNFSTNTDEDSNQEAKKFVCDAKFYGNVTRFINHSCMPNLVGIRSFTYHQDSRFPYIAFFANQDIQAGKELTLNYGDNYWIVKGARDKVFCLCQRPQCRFSRSIFPQTLKIEQRRIRQ